MAYLRREGPFFVGRLFLLFHLTEFSVRRCQESRESPTPKRQSQRRRACRVARELLAADFCPFFFYDFVSFCFVLFCLFFSFLFPWERVRLRGAKKPTTERPKKKEHKNGIFFLGCLFFFVCLFFNDVQQSDSGTCIEFRAFLILSMDSSLDAKKKRKENKTFASFFSEIGFLFFLSFFQSCFFWGNKKRKIY